MACPVMTRRVLKNLLLIIPVAAEFPQRRQSLFAPGRVEPAFGQDQLGGVDSVLYLGERHMYGFPARLGQRLKPCEPRLEAFHSSVVREIVIPGVFAVVQFTDVVFEKPARPGDEIDDAQALITSLKTPDRHIALISQIPCGVNRAVYDREIWLEPSLNVAILHLLAK